MSSLLSSLWPLASAASHTGLWTLCVSIGIGALLTILAKRLNLPTSALLLLGGFCLGNEGLGWIHSDALGDFLPIVVSLAIGIILFEGGLTLDLRDFKQTSPVIKRLLTFGVLTTWLGAAATVYLIFDISLDFALLMGSLIIVTGPTVILPLLRRIRIQQRVANILHWEAVLIDSVGVFIAILCFEWVVEGGGTVALPNFMLRIVFGTTTGLLGGYLIYLAMRLRWVPDSMINGFALASALLIFGLTELIKPEAGLLAVTLAGLIVGIKKPKQLKQLKAFKAEVVDLLIGLLFVLLVARLEWAAFVSFFQSGGLWVLCSILLLVRPVSVVLSTWGTAINLRERCLLSWVAPRGIVAASMASLFAISLNAKAGSVGDAQLLESFVYTTICATVLIQGLSAGFLARILKLQRPASSDWLILGAHRFGRSLAQIFEKKLNQTAILLDTNAQNVLDAQQAGLKAIHCDAMEAEKLYETQTQLFGAGYLIALTDNIELNELLMLRWESVLGSEHVFGWIPQTHSRRNSRLLTQSVFEDLARPARISAEMNAGERSLTMIRGNRELLTKNGSIPLFVQRNKQLRPIYSDKNLEEIIKEKDEVICLRYANSRLRRAMDLGDFMRLRVDNQANLFSFIVEQVVRRCPKVNEQKLQADLLRQAADFPPVIGNGVLMPHVHSEQIEQPVCFVLSLERQLQLEAIADSVSLVILLLSPAGDSEGHLALLSEVAKLCQHVSTVEAIHAVKSHYDLVKLVNHELVS